MRIIILGAGDVGGTLAENLAAEHHDITVVDSNKDRLSELQDKLDLRVVSGNAAHPRTLREAGAEDADMLVAVTNSDEINMVACQVAYTLFNTPNRIARIRASALLAEQELLFSKNGCPVDHLIAPEQLVVNYIRRLIEYPGALQVVDFASGRVSLVAVRAFYGGPLVGHPLTTFRVHMPNVEAKIAALYRNGRSIRPQPSTVIEADDEVFFVTAAGQIRAVMSELQRLESPYRRIMIVGGGNIGAALAKHLEQRYSVKIIEKNPARAELLSERMEKALVFCGDASNQELLQEEHIDQMDVFIAVTNEDETNIMSALLAKKLGAKKTMVLIQRSAYVDLIQGGGIDIALSPQQATISSLLGHIRRADIINVHSLRRGVAEAIEAIAHGDATTSKVVGRPISELKLPPGTTIGALVRGDEVLIAQDDLKIERDDHVIMFVADKKHIAEVERLFQPNPLYL